MSSVSSYQQNDTLSPHPPAEALELSARHLDRMMGIDSGAASLAEKLGGGVVGGGGGVSGLQDRDYPAVSGSGPEALALRQGAKVTRVPLPAELVEVNIDISSLASKIYRGRVTTS